MDFVVTFLRLLVQVLTFAIIGRALISWVDPSGNMAITRLLDEITGPIVNPIRRVMPTIGMFDFSPIVAILLLQLVGNTVINVLAGVV